MWHLGFGWPNSQMVNENSPSPTLTAGVDVHHTCLPGLRNQQKKRVTEERVSREDLQWTPTTAHVSEGWVWDN